MLLKLKEEHTDTSSDLIEIHTGGTSLANYLPDDAIQLWWTACNTSRRVNQVPRKPTELGGSWLL